MRRREVRPTTVVAVASLGMFMAFVDHTVVSVAFPNLLQSFADAGLASLSWVISAYNIVFAAFLVPAGRIADLVGRRRTFVAGIAVFTLASGLCALAPSVEALIAARTLQALGAATLVPASLALVLHAYPGEKRTQGVALWSAATALAAGLGPSIGGLLVDASSWRLVFLVNLPIGVLAWRLAGRELVESRAAGRRALPDLGGAVLVVVAVGALALGLVQSGDWGWASTGVVGCFVVAALALAWFVRRSLHHPAPVIDPGLFRDRNVAVANTLTLIGSIGFYALSLSTVIYLMTVWGYSPLKAGLAMTPAPFVGALAAVAAGRWRWDPRPLLLAGGLLWAGGAMALVRSVGTEPAFLREWLPIACTLSAGLGLTFPTVAGLAVRSGDTARFATETAINAAIRQLGAAIGVALLVVVFGTPTAAEAPAAYDRAWTVSAALFALVGVGALALGRRTGTQVAQDRTVIPPPRPVSNNASPRGIAAAPRPLLIDDPADPLAEVSIFARLDPARRRAVAAAAETAVVAGGDWLFRQGDPPDGLYVVRSGRLHVLRERPGAEPELLREVAGGDVIGELALLSGATRTASVRARRDSELLRISPGAFEELLAAEPELSRGLLGSVGALLERSRGIEQPPPAPPSAVAVVAGGPDAPAREVFEALTVAMPSAGRLVRADVDRIAALAAAVDRAEHAHGRVVMLAAEPPGDDWTDACVRTADRVVLVVGSVAPDPDAPRGADVILCGPPFPVGEIEPRSVHRARAGDMKALARRLSGRSVGLVLSGGGARALGHLGVLGGLEAAGVVVDRVAGASLGAMIGAMHAAGMDAAEIDARCYEEWVRRNPLGDYRVSRFSLIRGNRVRAMLERNLPARVEELWRPFFCVTTDLLSGELVTHRHGDLRLAVAASMCLPGLAPPVVMDRRLLVDGGVLDNLPVAGMAAMSEGPIVASKVNNSEAFAPDPDAPLTSPAIPETLYRLILLGAQDTVAAARTHAAVVITPDNTDVGMLEFHMLDRMREAGRRATEEALERDGAALL
jgi:EmrB/QacA subfamily drug resistance transporter